MRKENKKSLLEIVKTLYDAHKMVQSYMDNNDIDTAIVLLTECQNTAIGMGENIEASEGENAPTIACLQEYCEALYQLALAAEVEGEYDSRMVELDHALQRIENSIEDDIKIRKEIVFLPYKVSMWDSMESVWKAADEDPDCDTYVIPIPYYDRNADRSFGKMHYEGGLYPSDVPVVWYEDYNFAERKPDAIVIHNPYDGNNFVTSVAPFFYSQNIKQFTEQLIYIPYFVLSEVNPKNTEQVNGMAHFCTTPGVLYADKVIVQSDDMRQAYLDVLVRFSGENTRAIWEKKVLSLGSPKYDKVRSVKREDVVIPKDWISLLDKEDGSRKKVILYNTSLSALLAHRWKMIEKMKKVFLSFREKQDEVVLLWRPHPLIKATIESMCPELESAYSEIVESYKEEGFGIYDDTTDLNRAIALCDAYYGDPSSLIPMCQKIGKPAMIQNVNI